MERARVRRVLFFSKYKNTEAVGTKIIYAARSFCFRLSLCPFPLPSPRFCCVCRCSYFASFSHLWTISDLDLGNTGREFSKRFDFSKLATERNGGAASSLEDADANVAREVAGIRCARPLIHGHLLPPPPPPPHSPGLSLSPWLSPLGPWCPTPCSTWATARARRPRRRKWPILLRLRLLLLLLLRPVLLLWRRAPQPASRLCTALSRAYVEEIMKMQKMRYIAPSWADGPGL